MAIMNTTASPMDFAVFVIAANGGTIVGKTRLQKTVYLLQKLIQESVFEVDYHNFRTFSASLAQAIDVAEAFGRLRASEHQGYYSIPYVKYSTDEAPPNQLGKAKASEVTEWLKRIDQADPIVL